MQRNRSRACVAMVIVIALGLALAAVGCSDSGSSTATDSSPSSSSTKTGDGDAQILLFTQRGCSPCGDAEVLIQQVLQEVNINVDYHEIDVSVDRETAMEYRIQVTPTIVILDKEGNIVEGYAGVPDKATLRSALERATSE